MNIRKNIPYLPCLLSIIFPFLSIQILENPLERCREENTLSAIYANCIQQRNVVVPLCSRYFKISEFLRDEKNLRFFKEKSDRDERSLIRARS